ncbi:organic cation transporter protein-like [Maniola jurtina]|uniref:organic cation transporter protein-like n=1 Tax=Maniola jurtina TaxID=191418 RepID=UPI001E68F2BA|nr:organic cation transporter protein-like [Maniola jurtina]
MGLFKISPTQIFNKAKQQGSSEENDAVSAIIGSYGQWQLMMNLILPLFAFPSTFHLYLPTFTTKLTDFWCKRPANLSSLPIEYWINYSQPIDACSVRMLPAGITAESIMNNTAPMLDSFLRCTEWDYDRSEVGNTIISEWDLICDKASLTTLSEVAFLISVGVGGVLGGWFSDKFGRKRILMGMIALQSVLGILSIFVRTFVQYILVRLALGLVSVSVVYAAFVLSVELVDGPWVTIAGSLNFFPLPSAYIIVSLVSMALPDWRDLQLAVAIPGPCLLLLWFLIPESPRWLLSIGKIQEAKMVLEKAAKFNNRTYTEDFDKILTSHITNNKRENPSVLMLFKGYLLKRTFCLFVAWFSMSIAYYGLVLNIGKFNLGNLHVTSIILAAVEIPAIALSIPILFKTGRRTPVFASMIVCGLACIASELFSVSLGNTWVIISCLMIGKFTISATNVMLPIYTAELYPTVIRNLGVGATQVAAGLALICIPYLWDLTALNAHLPMSTLALLSIAGGGVILLLPDTKSAKNEMAEAADAACDGTFQSTENTL